jgi:hypothetical protein
MLARMCGWRKKAGGFRVVFVNSCTRLVPSGCCGNVALRYDCGLFAAGAPECFVSALRSDAAFITDGAVLPTPAQPRAMESLPRPLCVLCGESRMEYSGVWNIHEE